MLLDGPMGAEQLLRGGERTGLLEEKPKNDEPQLLEDHPMVLDIQNQEMLRTVAVSLEIQLFQK